jgi:hypothetical protein
MSDNEPTGPERARKRLSRRGFLGSAGVGAAALATTGGLLGHGATALASDEEERARASHFSRLFPDLESFAPPTDAVRNALLDIGKQGGIMDAGDVLLGSGGGGSPPPGPPGGGSGGGPGGGPPKDPNPDNPKQSQGTTFMGQFMDHDMTFDASSQLGVPTSPRATPNVRTPAFDLDSVYGRGPFADPHLYDPADRVKLRLESGGRFEDLPRTADMTAIVADPRDDENLITSQLHCAFMLFHNAVVDYVRAQLHEDEHERVFEEARRLVTWHYHWIILHEFLPLFVGRAMMDDLLANGRKFYLPHRGEASIPVEFNTAGYRFGHSLSRPAYLVNTSGDMGKDFVVPLFDPAEMGKPDPNDLQGGARSPRRFVAWNLYYDFGAGIFITDKMTDTRISSPMFTLPLSAISDHKPPTVLPQRTFLRHLTWSLPSGQSIARRIGAPVISATDLMELQGYGLGFERSTPLWYYILKESELVNNGGQWLGPTGGRIVGEVLLGLLETDPGSYLVRDRDWKPVLPSMDGKGSFKIRDLLTFAGVGPSPSRL